MTVDFKADDESNILGYVRSRSPSPVSFRDGFEPQNYGSGSFDMESPEKQGPHREEVPYADRSGKGARSTGLDSNREASKQVEKSMEKPPEVDDGQSKAAMSSEEAILASADADRCAEDDRVSGEPRVQGIVSNENIAIPPFNPHTPDGPEQAGNGMESSGKQVTNGQADDGPDLACDSTPDRAAETTNGRDESPGSNVFRVNETDFRIFRAIGRVRNGRSVVLDTAGREPLAVARSESNHGVIGIDDAIRLLESRGRDWMIWRRHDAREPAPENIAVER